MRQSALVVHWQRPPVHVLPFRHCAVVPLHVQLMLLVPLRAPDGQSVFAFASHSPVAPLQVAAPQHCESALHAHSPVSIRQMLERHWLFAEHLHRPEPTSHVLPPGHCAFEAQPHWFVAPKRMPDLHGAALATTHWSVESSHVLPPGH